MADGPLLITINGVDKTAYVLYDTLTIRDVLNQPKTCTFSTFNGYQPPAASTIVITRGTIALFAGSIVTVQQLYVGSVTNVNWAVSAINYNFLLRRRRPFKSYAAVSATTVAQDLVTTYSATFTSVNVQASLPSVTIAFDGTLDLAGCLSALATLIGGYWYVDDPRDVHLFLSEASATPDALDNSNTSALNDPPLTATVDYRQIRTRDYVIGGGTTTFAAAAVGATTLQVLDVTPFEPSGGTVKSGVQRITYTGLGAGYVPPAANWQTHTPASNRAWNGVCWAPSLGLFVAVAGGGSSADVMTSPDGVTWTTRVPAVNAGWTSVAWSASLSLFVACSVGGDIMSSPDGITWTTRTSPEANPWLNVIWVPGLTLFVMVATTGTHQVQTSPDGVTWTSRTAAAALQWRDVAWSPSLSLLVAVAFSGPSAAMSSPDGVAWTQHTTPTSGYSGVDWAPSLGLFVAVGSAIAMSSPDGTTWTSRTPANANAWRDVVWAADVGLFVAVSVDGAAVTGQRSMTSPDGITWTGNNTATVGTWVTVAWSPALSQLIAVGPTSGGAQVMTSTVITYRTLTGVSGVTAPILKGAPILLFVQRDDATAQSALAAIEDGGASDGIHEGVVTDASLLTVAACNAAGDADLSLFKNPITTITYTTRDLKTRSGKPIVVNRTHPPIGPLTLTIQDVTITNLGVAAPQGPIFTVSASTVKYTLQDLLARIVEGVGVT